MTASTTKVSVSTVSPQVRFELLREREKNSLSIPQMVSPAYGIFSALNILNTVCGGGQSVACCSPTVGFSLFPFSPAILVKSMESDWMVSSLDRHLEGRSSTLNASTSTCYKMELFPFDQSKDSRRSTPPPFFSIH